MMTAALRRSAIWVVLTLGVWQAVVWLTGLPLFLLPGPLPVAEALWSFREPIARSVLFTGVELVAGFALGAALGVALALGMAMWPRLRVTLQPVLLFSQTIPVFALAPLLTLWLGYGVEPKVAVAMLLTFFPVASAFLDGLTRTNPAYLDLARIMGASRWREMLRVRIPAALPSLGTGLRLASVYAPIGAVIGEWVGASEGLGALMIQANGRMRIDLLFAALLVLTLMTLAFFQLVDRLIARRLSGPDER